MPSCRYPEPQLPLACASVLTRCALSTLRVKAEVVGAWEVGGWVCTCAQVCMHLFLSVLLLCFPLLMGASELFGEFLLAN